MCCFLSLEPCLNVQLKDVVSGKYKNATYTKYEAHNEKNRGEWVRQGEMPSPYMTQSNM